MKITLSSKHCHCLYFTLPCSDSTIDGFADDYAFLIRGLLDLYDTCFDERWLEWAAELQTTQDKLFWDERAGGYYNTSAKDPSILLRIKEGTLGPTTYRPLSIKTSYFVMSQYEVLM